MRIFANLGCPLLPIDGPSLHCLSLLGWEELLLQLPVKAGDATVAVKGEEDATITVAINRHCYSQEKLQRRRRHKHMSREEMPQLLPRKRMLQ